MNVTDDALCRDFQNRSIRDLCKDELNLISRIEMAKMESRDKCELLFHILAGDSCASIEEVLKEKEIV